MAKVLGAKVLKFLVITSIIYNFNHCANGQIPRNDHYVVYSDLPYLGSTGTIVKLREKRQTPTDLKNQYQSVSQNANVTNNSNNNNNDPTRTIIPASSTAATPIANNNNNNKVSTTEQSIVVPYNNNNNNSERPLLGVNGTGQQQRKDYNAGNMKSKLLAAGQPSSPSGGPAPVSDGADNTGDGGGDKKPSQYPKKVPSKPMQASDETSEEKLIDNFDVPDNETITELEKHNLKVNMTTDHHIYYNSTIYINKEEAEQIWNAVKNTTHNSMLSQSHRRAMTVELSFNFPFYGHPVRNLTVATGGFLYTGDYVHSWLAATQYIAPLMANFDTSISNESYVRLNDNGTAFTAIWENVPLQDRLNIDKFTFSATLHKNGDIVFTYHKVPILISSIQDDKHPVKVGLSDAYIIDKVVNFARRKTIYEYHRANFGSVEIRNGTIVRLTALTTCLDYTDCVACVNHDTSFHCSWCPALNRCSSGTDRRKQEWTQKGCDKTMISEASTCPAIGTQGNDAATASTINSNNNNNNNNNDDGTKPTSPSNDNNNNNNNNANTGGATSNTNNNNNNNSNNNNQNNYTNNTAHDTDSPTITPLNGSAGSPVSSESKTAYPDGGEPKTMGMAMGVIVPICLVITIMAWILYAYRNPHTKSGQLLIQYRPSQWSWRRGEARYTAATIHM